MSECAFEVGGGERLSASPQRTPGQGVPHCNALL